MASTPVHSILSEVSLGSCTGNKIILGYVLVCPSDHANYLVGLPYYLGNVMTGAQCFCYYHAQISFLDSLFNVVISGGINMMLISVANM